MAKRRKCARGRYKTGPKKGDCVCAHGLTKSGKKCRKHAAGSKGKRVTIRGRATFGGYHRAAGGKLRLRKRSR